MELMQIQIFFEIFYVRLIIVILLIPRDFYSSRCLEYDVNQ